MEEKKIITRVMRNRAPIGDKWRAQVGWWNDGWSPLLGPVKRRFHVLEETWKPTKEEAKAWADNTYKERYQ